MMKRSIARKWAAALDSGEYKQTQGTLRKGDKFCCLGVLCSLHAEAHPDIAKKEKSKKEYLGETAFLPDEVMSWSNMDSSDGSLQEAIIVDGIVHVGLAGLNDSAKLTFPEIAKVIRKHWKRL